MKVKKLVVSKATTSSLMLNRKRAWRAISRKMVWQVRGLGGARPGGGLAGRRGELGHGGPGALPAEVVGGDGVEAFEAGVRVPLGGGTRGAGPDGPVEGWQEDEVTHAGGGGRRR